MNSRKHAVAVEQSRRREPVTETRLSFWASPEQEAAAEAAELRLEEILSGPRATLERARTAALAYAVAAGRSLRGDGNVDLRAAEAAGIAVERLVCPAEYGPEASS